MKIFATEPAVIVVHDTPVLPVPNINWEHSKDVILTCALEGNFNGKIEFVC